MSRVDPGTPGPPKKKTAPPPWFPPGNSDPGHHPTSGEGSPGDPEPPGPPPAPGAPPAPDPGPPPPPAPPPPPPKMDWAAYLKSDPGYASTIANLQGQENQLLTQYGAVPAGVQLIGSDGQPISADVSSAAANNPNSTVAMLARQLTGNISNVQNNANAHGVLFSGANLQNQQNEQTAGQQRSYGALQALQNGLLGLGGQQSQAYNNAYSNWFNYFNAPAGG